MMLNLSLQQNFEKYLQQRMFDIFFKQREFVKI